MVSEIPHREPALHKKTAPGPSTFRQEVCASAPFEFSGGHGAMFALDGLAAVLEVS